MAVASLRREGAAMAGSGCFTEARGTRSRGQFGSRGRMWVLHNAQAGPMVMAGGGLLGGALTRLGMEEENEEVR